MATALPDDVVERLDNLSTCLRDLERQVEVLTTKPWDQMTAGLSPLEKSKLNLMVAYTSHALFFIYLKIQGGDTVGHGVTQELDRIKAARGKLAKVGAHQTAEKSRMMQLNVSAAQRFIAAGLGGVEVAGESTGRASPSEKRKKGGEGVSRTVGKRAKGGNKR